MNLLLSTHATLIYHQVLMVYCKP